jgi:hypothetical protein
MAFYKDSFTFLPVKQICKYKTGKTRMTLGIQLSLPCCSEVRTLHKQQTSHTKNNTQSSLDLRNATLGYGFHFQHRNPRTLRIESFARDSGRASVGAEYVQAKGSANANS